LSVLSLFSILGLYLILGMQLGVYNFSYIFLIFSLVDIYLPFMSSCICISSAFICFDQSQFMFRIVFWDVLPCKMIVRQYIPEDNSEHHTRCRENLKSHTVSV
jgi:hypothetical protein